MSGVLPVFPQKSLRSGFWISLLAPFPDELTIDLTAISTVGIITFSIAVEIVSCMRFWTVETALSTALLICRQYIFNDLFSTCTVNKLLKIIMLTIGLLF